jgi:hypothetical protein
MNTKPLLMLALGCLGGAAATFGLVRGASLSHAPGAWQALIGGVMHRVPRGAASIGFDGRLAAYRRAAALDDGQALERELVQASGAPSSARRTLELDASLSRLSELDPQRGAELAASLRLPPPLIARSFSDWASIDAEASLAALATLRSRKARIAAALGELDAIGTGPSGRERVMAALPAADRSSVRGEHLAQMAASDPEAGFSGLRDIQNVRTQRDAALRIAEIRAQQTPQDALSRAVELPPALRDEVRQAIIAAWARVDLAGVLEHLEATADPTLLAGLAPWVRLIAPERLLELALRVDDRMADRVPDRMPDRVADAATDPVIDPATSGAAHELASSVAGIFARHDPRAAEAWLDARAVLPAEVRLSLVAGIAAAAPEDAVRLLDDLPRGIATANTVLSIALDRVQENPALTARVADGLLDVGDAPSLAALATLVSRWMQDKSDDALEWILTHGARVNAATLGRAAAELAARDPEMAMRALERLPPALSDVWAAQIVAPYVRADAEAALDWVASRQDQAGFEAIARRIIAESAERAPAMAARRLTESLPAVQVSAAPTVAAAWADREPEEAARWALGLGDARARALAVDRVAFAWASHDAEAARRWTLQLPRGPERDGAIAALLARSEPSLGRDTVLLDAFSDDEARQQAVVTSLYEYAEADAPAARALIDRYVRDPALRSIAETTLAAATTP